MAPPSSSCASCAAPLADDQRYCLECGTRRGPSLPATGLPRPAVADGAAVTPARSLAGARVVGLLTLGMLVAGFAVGGLGGAEPAASSTAPGRRLVVVAGPPVAAAPAPAAAPGPPPAVTAAPASTPPAATAPATEATPPSAVAPAPDPAPSAPEPAADAGDTPAGTPKQEDDDEPPAATKPPAAVAKLPPVAHVWVISLADRGLTSTFGPGSADPWVRDELVREGVLLNNFHATGRGTAANGVALLSGQGANAATDGDCSQPTAVTPGTVPADDELGQVRGDGCVYPGGVDTLAGQLTAADKTWKVYAADIAPGRLSTSPTCAAARSPRNPFTAFAALTDPADCPKRIVGLDPLAGDLAEEARTPTLSWIVPDACHDGRDAPCAPDAPAGLPAASAWLRPVLEEIRASPAYATGLVVILADRAPVDGPAPDTSARKGAPAGQGGGLVPALLLSPFVTPGRQIAAAYDHFSLLGSLEDLFGVERLGQAGRPGLRTFGPRVFGAYAPPGD